MKKAANVGNDDLISFGTSFGKFTKTNNFRLHITALDYLAPYAKVYVNCTLRFAVFLAVCYNIKLKVLRVFLCVFYGRLLTLTLYKHAHRICLRSVAFYIEICQYSVCMDVRTLLNDYSLCRNQVVEVWQRSQRRCQTASQHHLHKL